MLESFSSDVQCSVHVLNDCGSKKRSYIYVYRHTKPKVKKNESVHCKQKCAISFSGNQKKKLHPLSTNCAVRGKKACRITFIN